MENYFTIDLPVIGGREAVFELIPKVLIWRPENASEYKTTEGQIISRLRFNIVPVNTEPLLTNDTKNNLWKFLL